MFREVSIRANQNSKRRSDFLRQMGFVGVFSNELEWRSTQITTKNCTNMAYAVIQRVYL
jgi:hypothetical protein